MKPTLLLASIGLCLCVADIHAVKLYKWVDETGKVTYQDRPPPNSAAGVEEKNIDPDQNTLKFVIPQPQESSTTAAGRDQPDGAVTPRSGDSEGDSAGEQDASRRFAPAVAGGGAAGAEGSSSGGVAPTPPPPAVPPPGGFTPTPLPF